MKETNNTLTKWLHRNLKIEIPNSGSSCSLKIKKDLSQDIKKTLFEESYWLGTINLQKIEDQGFYISLDLSNDDYSKKLMISEDYLILSYHLTFGDEGNSILINLKTMDYQFLDGYYVNSMVTKKCINVEQDFLTPNEGRVWEYGTYDIESKQYTFLLKEN